MLNVPQVRQFRSMQLYLAALKEANKDLHYFSYRYLCKRLGFAPSLISDVVAGRRKLPLSKALELARFLGLDADDKQYLLLLSQLDPEDKEMAAFIDEISYPVGHLG